MQAALPAAEALSPSETGPAPGGPPLLLRPLVSFVVHLARWPLDALHGGGRRRGRDGSTAGSTASSLADSADGSLTFDSLAGGSSFDSLLDGTSFDSLAAPGSCDTASDSTGSSVRCLSHRFSPEQRWEYRLGAKRAGQGHPALTWDPKDGKQLQQALEAGARRDGARAALGQQHTAAGLAAWPHALLRGLQWLR